jgi:hypothetical protein
MDPFALKAATVAGPDEGEETVFLDEGDEDLIEDNDFYEGEITTTESLSPRLRTSRPTCTSTYPTWTAGRGTSSWTERTSTARGRPGGRSPRSSRLTPWAAPGKIPGNNPSRSRRPSSALPPASAVSTAIPTALAAVPAALAATLATAVPESLPAAGPGPQAPPWHSLPRSRRPGQIRCLPRPPPLPCPAIPPPSEDEVDLDMLESLEDNLSPTRRRWSGSWTPSPRRDG